MANAPNPESANTASAAPTPSADDETAVPESKIATGTFSLRAPSIAGEVGTLGPYRIVKQLGKGGMGAVYLATDTRLERKIALKLMLPEFAADRDAKDRFLREARAAAKIAHDNVVTVYEADERDGIPYIAMQFLQGYPLDEFLRTKGPPPLAHCVRIGIEAARGLAAAHELGLVHRDIKPANLWLEAPNGRVKVLDFGLAKPIGTDAELTKSGAVVGTPAYMSPEQARATKVDHRTDIFSLGTVMYRLLTGRNPFVGANVMAVLMALGTEDPAPIRERNPNVPEALAAFVHRMLAKNPDARPQTALEVATGLRAALSQSATEHHPAQPVVVLPVPVPVTEAHESAFANLFDDDHDDAHARTEREAEPAPPDAPTRGKGLLIAGGALALVAVIGAAIALGTGGKKPDDVAKNPDPPPAPPVKQGKETPPTPIPPAPKTDGTPRPVAAGTAPVEVLTFKGHTEAVSTAAFSPDGARIVTAGWDKLAKVWDSKTGVEAMTLRGHTDFVLSAGYSPDGTRIVTTSSDNTAKVWDAKTGAELFALKGHSGFVLTARFNADGTRIVTASADQTAKVWDLPNPPGAKNATVILTLAGHARAVNSAVFTPDETRILTASTDETAKLWNAKTGAELHTIKGHAGSVTSASFGANGTRILTSSSDNTAKVWEVSWGKPDGGPVTVTELLVLKGHTGFGLGAAFSADSTRVVTASGDKTAKVWEVPSGKPEGIAKTGAELCALTGHEGFVRAAAFSPDGARIVTASTDHTAKVWELRDAARAAAEWVFSVGGAVQLVNGEGNLRAAEQLPKEPFRLRNVVLVNAKGVTGEGLYLLRHCPELEAITASGSDVTDATLARLSGMRLNHVLVADTAIGDDGLAVVKTLKEVHDLHFENTRITDKGLVHLAGMKLNGLYLNGTAITDSGLPALFASDPRHLFLNGTKVTAAGVLKLGTALPNCTITWDGGVIEPKK